jgi:T1SS-143 domain-containing protein
MAFTISGSLAIDETSGTQNAQTTSNAFADNDVTLATLSAPAGAPEFDLLLTAVAGAGVSPTGVSVSNADAANPTGTPLLTVLGPNVTNLAFTDSAGQPLNGDVAKFSATDLLLTADGYKIFLYSYSALVGLRTVNGALPPDLSGVDENNAVFGIKANISGAGGEADPNGAIVFAAYLQPTNASGTVQSSDLNAAGAKVWMVEYQAIQHGTAGSDATAYDDARSLFDPLFVSVSNRTEFSLEGAPSGQNLFLMYADGTPAAGEAAIVVTGKNPINQSIDSSGITSGDTVNTGQGGGKTTIGSNNQMIDPNEGMYFSFVKLSADSVPLTVPNLDQNEADLESNIKFDSFLGQTEAIFAVVQLQPPKACTLLITALNNADGTEKDSLFIDGLNDGTGADSHGTDDDTLINISSVTITRVVKVGKTATTYNLTYSESGAPTSSPPGGPLGDITVDFSDTTAKLTGVLSGDVIDYKTDALHNRVLIDNVGNSNANLNAAFDIGGFSLISASTVPDPFRALSFQDDGPSATGAAVTATVDEDGLSGGIAGGVGDVAGEAFSASGSVAGIFDPGADGLGSYSLSTDTSGLPQTLTSQGGAVVYDVTNNLLTAYVEVTGAGYNAADDREVFTLALNGTTGAYIFTLLDQLDHPTLNGLAGDDTENDLTLNLGSILQVFDKDGDSAKAAAEKLVITVDDDTPVVRSITNIVGFNSGAPLTGKYDFGLGADEPGNAAADGIVLNANGLTGTTSGGRAITDAVVAWQSETATSVTFAFNFNYFITSAPSTAQLPASGTVTFNKLDGTYAFDLVEPIAGTTTFSTSDIAGLKTYDTQGANSPEITVKEYTADFVGVLYAQTTDGGKDVILDMKAGGDFTFSPGDIFTSVQPAYINVSTATLGADSDTLQPYEVLNFDFFVDNPVVPASPSGTNDNPVSTPGAAINFATGKALVDTVAITLSQISINGQDDVAILLKLRNTTDGTLTTKLLIANSATDYVAVGGNHVVTIGTDDYDSAHYQIYGVQILASTENVLGGTNEGFRLSDGTAVTLTAGNGTYADTSDNDVLKIVKIDVTVRQPADADLNFVGKVIDADGDATPNFNFGVHLEGDSQVLAGGAGSDYLNGTSAADTMSGGAGPDFMTGAAGADQFVFAPGDSGVTLATADTITDFTTAVDKIATSKLAGNATIADGGALADFTAFVAAADAVLNAGAGTNDIYVAYNAAGSGNAWVVVDENDSGAVNAGDTVVVLTGINLATEIAAADFI